MRIKSYAKVNLFLKVYPKKENELLHDIFSFFQLYTKLFDWIKIKESDENEIIYLKNSKTIWIDDCIIHKLLVFLKTNFKIEKKYKIIINKKIPIGSGLGGSSSNAAAVAKYILKNERIKINNINIFVKLGSDIPFFITGFKNALVTKYGGNVKLFKNPKLRYSLYKNNFNSSTKKVYNKVESNYHSAYIQINYLYEKKIRLLENDLEKSFLLEYPIFEKYFIKLSKKFIVKLSGSGSTLILYKRKKYEK